MGLTTSFSVSLRRKTLDFGPRVWSPLLQNGLCTPLEKLQQMIMADCSVWLHTGASQNSGNPQNSWLSFGVPLNTSRVQHVGSPPHMGTPSREVSMGTTSRKKADAQGGVAARAPLESAWRSLFGRTGNLYPPQGV